MKKIFSNFTFSVFKYKDIEIIKKIIEELFKERIDSKKAYITVNEFKIDNYIDSFKGNTLYDVFSFWKTSQYPEFVFFTSNSGDGRFTLCNIIHQRLKCEYIQCTMRNGNEELAPGYFFHYANKEMDERDILAYKEDKWVFYEKGTPLLLECMELYKKRRINQRINNSIIIDYLQKYGINFMEIDVNITNSFTYSGSVI